MFSGCLVGLFLTRDAFFVQLTKTTFEGDLDDMRKEEEEEALLQQVQITTHLPYSPVYGVSICPTIGKQMKGYVLHLGVIVSMGLRCQDNEVLVGVRLDWVRLYTRVNTVPHVNCDWPDE